MLIVERPYFLTNKKWYYYDENNYKYVLTDKASQKAKNSYNEYYNKFDDNILDIYLDLYYNKFEDILPLMSLKGYNEDELINIVKICLKNNRNVYEMGYLTLDLGVEY